jgi:hypothetical protein
MTKFLRSTVIAIAGVQPETLRQWRDRLGFEPAEKTEGRHSLYSTQQICALKLATTLIDAGLRAGAAVAVAKKSTDIFAKLLQKIDQTLSIPHIGVVYRDGDEHELFLVFCETQIGDVLSIANGFAVIVDLLAIAHDVVCGLQDNGHPVICDDREAIADHARAFARGFA